MKIKSLRLALEGRQPGVPNRDGLQRQSLRRAGRTEGPTRNISASRLLGCREDRCREDVKADRYEMASYALP